MVKRQHLLKDTQGEEIVERHDRKNVKDHGTQKKQKNKKNHTRTNRSRLKELCVMYKPVDHFKLENTFATVDQVCCSTMIRECF